MLHPRCPECGSFNTIASGSSAEVLAHTLNAKQIYQITDQVKAVVQCDDCKNKFIMFGTIDWKYRQDSN